MDTQEKTPLQPENPTPEMVETSVQSPSSEEGSVSTTEVSTPTTPFYKNTQLMVSLLVALVILLGAGYYVYSTQAKGGVVAVVNGEKIYRDALNENIERMQQGAVQQGMDITDPALQSEIQTQSLQILIDNALLMKAASDIGITASEEEIQEKYEELIAQTGGEEALNALLVEANLTIDELKENIEERVIIDKYFEEVSDIEGVTITDEEITEFLSAFDPADLPPLEEIRPQVEAQIRSQKQQEIVDTILQDLRDNAEIEQKI
jgi:peptidyl-prolyl cis-trans isomerase SurA